MIGHSEDMADDEYYWCLKHQRVESGDKMCPARHRLGPYPTRSEAEHALDIVAARNETWDEQDSQWKDGPSGT